MPCSSFVEALTDPSFTCTGELGKEFYGCFFSKLKKKIKINHIIFQLKMSFFFFLFHQFNTIPECLFCA